MKLATGSCPEKSPVIAHIKAISNHAPHWPGLPGQFSQLMRLRNGSIVWLKDQCLKGHRGGFAPPTQEVGCVVVVGCGGVSLMSLCGFLVLSRLCCSSGIVCGLLVVGLGEWAPLKNRMMLLWVCPGTALPAQLLYIISGSSCHTPATDMIE